jgi:hypothetical protein
MAGNMIRWVESFLSDRRAMLVIDGRTGQTNAIQVGLPPGSPVSPVLSILSVSALFQRLEDRHLTLQAISFVDDICLVVECDELEEGTKNLERIAEDTMQCSARPKCCYSAGAEESCSRHTLRTEWRVPRVPYSEWQALVTAMAACLSA